jgi:hypothetical protein
MTLPSAAVGGLVSAFDIPFKSSVNPVQSMPTLFTRIVTDADFNTALASAGVFVSPIPKVSATRKIARPVGVWVMEGKKVI